MPNIPLDSVPWGPTDAGDNDDQFADKWIEPETIKTCLLPHQWIISGEKGSGKSAIRRSIKLVYGDRYSAIADVDFESVGFRPLYDNIVKISQATNVSQYTLLSNAWQYALLVELLAACAERMPDDYGQILARVPPDRRGERLNERLLALLEEIWAQIDNFTMGPDTEKRGVGLVETSGLSATFVDRIQQFPKDKQFGRLRDMFFSRLRERSHRVIIVLDGLDRLRNEGSSPASVRLLFAALIDAVRSFRRYPGLPPNFEIKAIIPHDRYLDLDMRDYDKVSAIHSEIRWSSAALQEMLARRIRLVPKAQGVSFATAWKAVMPDQVINTKNGMPEDSYDYVLRHTMYRPRHMQMHMLRLADRYPGLMIEPSMVPSSIAGSSQEIARSFLHEYTIDLPGLAPFVHSLRRRDNQMTYRDFRDLVFSSWDKKGLSQGTRTTEDIVDEMFRMGLFGLLVYPKPGDERPDRYYPPSRDSKKHYVDFYYKEALSSVTSFLKDDEYIVLHPVFVDLLSLRTDPNTIIG